MMALGRRKVLSWVIGIAASLVGAWAGYTHFYEGGLGQPEYTVVDTYDGVEFRQYEPFVIASVLPDQTGESGLSNGFRQLAGYIFGGNHQDESLAMTAPVLQQDAPGESLPMTAPVLQSGDSMRMAFVMPAERTIDDLPIPNNADVTLSDVDWGEAAAIRFAGRGKQAKFQEAEAELRAVLEAQQRTPAGPALYAQYNSPSAFPPLRRNEVIIPLVSE